MLRRGYFGHVNPEGLGPTNRGQRMGFTTPIG